MNATPTQPELTNPDAIAVRELMPYGTHVGNGWTVYTIEDDRVRLEKYRGSTDSMPLDKFINKYL